MRQKCIVLSCQSGQSGQDEAGITYFSFPKITYNKLNPTQPNLITVRRLDKWKEACKIQKSSNVKNIKICSRHFVSGRPAKKMEMKNVDWIPTLRLEDDEEEEEDTIVEEEQEEEEVQLHEQEEEEEEEEEMYKSYEMPQLNEEYVLKNEMDDTVIENFQPEHDIDIEPPARKMPKLLNASNASNMHHQNITEIITINSFDDHDQDEEEEEDLIETTHEDKMCQTDLTLNDIEKLIRFYKINH